MPGVPRCTAKKVIAVLEKNGFVLARQSGSHKIYKNAMGKRVTVPYHAGKVLRLKTMKSIIRDSEINPLSF
jgi:predicted RNA binding protein YcfA (HicA-like mRNA interferase family)